MLEQLDIFGAAAPIPMQDDPAERSVKPCIAPCPAAMKAATAAIGSLRGGERVVYHTGRLSADRLSDAILGGTATAYSKAAEKGLVILSQRRLSADRYEYIAIKKGR